VNAAFAARARDHPLSLAITSRAAYLYHTTKSTPSRVAFTVSLAFASSFRPRASPSPQTFRPRPVPASRSSPHHRPSASARVIARIIARIASRARTFTAVRAARPALSRKNRRIVRHRAVDRRIFGTVLSRRRVARSRSRRASARSPRSRAVVRRARAASVASRRGVSRARAASTRA